MTTTSRIGGKRLERAGGGGAAAWATRLSAGALVLAAGWTLWNGLRPLSDVAGVESQAPGALPRVDARAPDVEARRDLLARVGKRNLFSPDGHSWEAVRVEEAKPDDGTTKVTGDTDTPGHGRIVPTDAPPTNVNGIKITAEADVPDDVKKAREGLRLRGIGSGRDGLEFAMITMESEKDARRSRLFRAGDKFVDEKFKKGTWRVLAVDAAMRLVVLERSGANVVLPLYDQSEEQIARLMSTGLKGQPAPVAAIKRPEVEVKSAQEIAAALREAGFADEEIMSLLARARAGTGSDLAQLEQIIAVEAPRAEPGPAGAPAGEDEAPLQGIGDIFRIMMSGQAPPSDFGQPAAPAPEEPANEPQPPATPK